MVIIYLTKKVTGCASFLACTRPEMFMSDEEMVLWIKHGLEIPIRKSPIRFAIQMKSGLTSNAWGVHVENTGDAYIYCRDNMKG